jgi:2-polyprenyl-3-methyl-5-hydroxy-6-metoxy-1,4-benzoquinol methylase
MDKSEKFWDRQAESFTDHGKGIQLADNKDFQSVMKYLKPTDTVLDYGCATGIISNAIADKAKEVQGIDISPKMIEIAKMRAHALNLENVNYAQGSTLDDRFQAASFDMVLAFRVIHMLKNPEDVVSRINQLLKPGGVFISVTACMSSYKALMGIAVFLLGKTGIIPEHINFFKLPELHGLMTGAGLQILESEKMEDSTPHYCIVARKP